jgi:hypothetical protein
VNRPLPYLPPTARYVTRARWLRVSTNLRPGAVWRASRRAYGVYVILDVGAWHLTISFGGK